MGGAPSEINLLGISPRRVPHLPGEDDRLRFAVVAHQVSSSSPPPVCFDFSSRLLILIQTEQSASHPELHRGRRRSITPSIAPLVSLTSEFFRKFHAAYVDAVLNPFHVPGKKITWRAFAETVSNIVRSYGLN